MHQDPSEPPLNPLPPAVTALALTLFGVEVVLSAAARGLVGGQLGIGWRQTAVERYAFFGEVFDQMIARGVWPLTHVARFVTYPFVHWGFTHMLFAVVFLLALGKMVAEAFGSLAFFGIFFGSAIAGALVYGLALDDPAPLAGGFPAVYGLIGAFTFLLWTNLGRVGANQYRAFTLIGFLLGIQLVFGLFFGATNDWIADLAGFAAGFALSFLVSPGGWARVVAKLRRR